MTNEQIAKLVEEKNKGAEDYLTYQARSLIGQIADTQACLRAETQKANEKIAKYRKQLAELSFETVTVADILGEEGVE